jgi:hypothetical protein
MGGCIAQAFGKRPTSRSVLVHAQPFQQSDGLHAALFLLGWTGIWTPQQPCPRKRGRQGRCARALVIGPGSGELRLVSVGCFPLSR